MGVSTADARRIASVLSGTLKVSIQEGDTWAYNFRKKTIYYRPWDLQDITEEDVVANFLHEAGHAKYSLGPKKYKWDKSKISYKHRNKLTLLINVVEDFRIEDKLRAEYPYANTYLPEYSFKTKFILRKKLEQYRKKPKYLQYCWGIYSHIAGAGTPFRIDGDVRRAIKKTKDFAKEGRFVKDDQGIATIIEKHIYKYIKKFLDEYPEEEEGEAKVILSSKPTPPRWVDPYKEIKPLIAPTFRTFKRILTDVSFDKYAGKYRTGQLNPRKLYKLRSGDLKLFERRVVAESKNYTFALVVDESGSMRYDRGGKNESRILSATKGAALFSAVLQKLKIPYSLHGFNGEIHHYKKTTESIKLENTDIFRDMYRQAWTRESGDNNDGEALFEVRKRMPPTMKRRIMFILSDGQPVPNRRGMDYPLHTEVENTIKEGIELVGFGIGGSFAVEEYYKDHVIVGNIEELPQAILKELKNKFK